MDLLNVLPIKGALESFKIAVDPYAKASDHVFLALLQRFDETADSLIARGIPLHRSFPVLHLSWKPGDVVGAAFWFVVYWIARFVLEKGVFEPLSLRLAVPREHRGPMSSLPQKYRDAVTKWTESAWKMVIYAFFVAIAVISVYDQDFLHRSAALWEGCFDLPCEFRHAPRLRSIYLMEMSYYTYGIFALFFWEARRKDHLVMLAHHVVTLGLIAFSFWYNFLRVGVLIMLLHDVCDVPMEFAKVIRYSNPDMKSGALNLASEVVFFTFFIIWIIARVLYYPLYVIASVTFESCFIITGYIPMASCYPSLHIFAGMLISLFCMHVYWTRLLMVIILRWFIHGDRDDVREEEDEAPGEKREDKKDK